MSPKVKGAQTGSSRTSTVGRPRQVTDEQVAAILAWHEGIQALKTLRAILKPCRQFAASLGVSTGSVFDVILCRGEFKQASPERRKAANEIEAIEAEHGEDADSEARP